MMRSLDLSFATPEENLAFDEALLEAVEGGHSHDTLRLWESPVPFVVLGTGQRLAQEVREEVCVADGVPIMRRCSAGGCVLQGPGCLNYSFVSRYERGDDLRSLCKSYDYVLGRLVGALRSAGIDAGRAGTSDIAVDERKISGNAQRRKRFSMLHHGTLLYRADAEAMARYLAEPEERPEYRGDRTHGSFVTALPMAPLDLRELVRRAFGVHSGPSMPLFWETEMTQRLVKEKYATQEWIRRR